MKMAAYMPVELELVERLHWLTRLRWLAVIAVFIFVMFAQKILKVTFNAIPVYILALSIAFYNFLFTLYLKHIEKPKIPTHWIKAGAYKFAHLQISLDWLALILIIHFTGGVENPFILYFVFHMVIATILLPAIASYIQATLAISFFGLMAALEYYHVIPHVYLKGFIKTSLYDQGIYVLSVFLVFASTLYILVFLATSITKRLRARTRELVRLKEELEQANISLREQDRLKSEYVLMVSHNLRAPLSAIQSLLRVVLDGIIDEVGGKTKELLERTEHRTMELIHLVKDLLNLSRIRAQKTLDFKPSKLTEIIQRAIEDMRLHAEDKDINLEIAIPPDLPELEMDRGHMEHVFINLITNAIKYTPNHGKVYVRAEDQGEEVQVEVSDTGIGIPPEDLPKIFDEFFRAKNAKEFEPDGTGLGLSLVKYIIQKHSGQISVESQPDKGTKFSFTLPKRPAVKPT